MPAIVRLLPLLALLPMGLAAQEPHILPDALLPRPGEVWIELTPSLLDWDEEFGADGSRRPLASRFDGPILSRFFPPIGEGIRSDLNQDAAALGFEPLAEDEVSVGELDFGTLQAQVVRLLATARVGLHRRVAVELGAPIVATRVEAGFAWDTAAATLARASVALPDGEALLGSFDDARSALSARISEGGLSPEEEAQALALLDEFGGFLEALRSRVLEDRFLPLAGSLAGARMLARLGELSDGFEAFEIGLPGLPLLESPGVADLQALFAGDPFFGRPPGTSTQSLDVGEVEAGLRVGLIDTSRRPGTGLRLRTTAGVKLRLPTRSADAPPFLVRTDPLRLPIGDGQRDLELSAFQDLWVGARWRIESAGLVGFQAADDLRVRVSPPDRPFALPETEAAVRRDPGDYVQLRVAPRYLLHDALSLGLDYGFWHKGGDEFQLLEDVPGVADAGPLGADSDQTRHRLGVGVFLAPGQGTPTEESGSPWRLGVAVQWASAGSGGRTPASRLVTATLRLPLAPF